MLYRRKFFIQLKVAIYKSCLRSAILYQSEAWYLKESEMKILQTEKCMVRAMCGVQVEDRKRPKDLMLRLGLNETIDWLAMENCSFVWKIG